LRPAAANVQQNSDGVAQPAQRAPIEALRQPADFQISGHDASSRLIPQTSDPGGEPAGRDPGSRMPFEPPAPTVQRPDPLDTAPGAEAAAPETAGGPRPEPAAIQPREPLAARATEPAPPPEPQRPPVSPSERLADAASPAPPAKPPAAVRQVELDLTPDPNREVTVTLRERAGNVEVEVRAQDPLMRQQLQSEVGELVGNLERSGYEVDVAPRAAQDLPFDAAGGQGRGNSRHSDPRSPHARRRGTRPGEWNQVLEQTTWQTQ
jgi:hypothetical protein